ncbi:MAG: hypothetical protein IPG24_04415 [Leptospiraceae bacterium]|nr:hypothetical protein [Leptospiraceae bacterium]
MRKISLLLIFCFLFQGCATLFLGVIGDSVDTEVFRRIERNKDCNFEEVISQNVVSDIFYRSRFLIVGSFVDMGLSIYYFLNFNPRGFVLFANGLHAFVSTIWFASSLRIIYDEPSTIYFSGWRQYYATECREEYFIFSYKNRERLNWTDPEILVKKAILNYPHNQDISQDQNFTNFQKDFLRNYKIQTYSKGNYFYHYIHYLGGKAKFEEDFGKYLYKP